MLPPLVATAATALVAIGLVTAVAWIWLELEQRQERRRRQWLEAGARLGLRDAGPGALAGEVDGVFIEATVTMEDTGRAVRTISRVSAGANLPGDVQLAAEGLLSNLLGSDIEIGDARFDRAVNVRGHPGAALALLDPVTRALVAKVVHEGWTFREGAWTFHLNARMGAELEPIARQGVALIKAMRRAATVIAPRLVGRVRSDPEPGVRLRALEYLVRRHAGARAEAAARSALGDADPHVRFAAARHLGDVPVLIALSARTDLPATLRREVATALARTPSPSAEAALVTMLADSDQDVAIAAARALGRVATVSAVAALVPLRDRSGPVCAAAREAILAIQARAGALEAGALALAAAGGGLTLARAASPDPEP